MTLVVCDARRTLDDLRDTLQCPQVRTETVRLRTTHQLLLNLSALFSVQTRQAACATGTVQPFGARPLPRSQPVDRALARNVETTRYLGGRDVLREEARCFESALLHAREIAAGRRCFGRLRCCAATVSW